jgi:hypothetical protein
MAVPDAEEHMPGRLRSLSVAALVLGLVLGGCGRSATTPSQEPSRSIDPGSPSPSAVESPVSSASARADADADVVVTRDVAYERSSVNELGLLDVYAPRQAGAGLPVVVMFHGGTMGVYKEYLGRYATGVADLGFVVFVPSWGHSGGAEYDALAVRGQLAADAAQAACAAAFATEHAGEYGGDASSFTVFGHSFGANVGSIVVLAPPELADGCLATGRPPVDVFVPWEGDWLLTCPFCDPWLVDDRSLMEVITPWSHLPAPPGLRFVVLRSENPGEGRGAADATGPDGWLILRDPDGVLTAALDANGACDTDIIGPAAGDTVLIDRLQAQGVDVTLEIMPDSSHEKLSEAGWEVFLDAFAEIGRG